MTPLEGRERYPSLDVLRGVALFGVLMVNLPGFFRVSLFEHPRALNHAVDIATAAVLEFKAFALFSLACRVQPMRREAHAL